MVPEDPGSLSRICLPRRSRKESSPLGATGLNTSTLPRDRPTPPRPANHASRAKSCVPGRAIEGGGAIRARNRSLAPVAMPCGAPSALIEIRTRGGREAPLGSKVRRRSPLEAIGSTRSTVASNAATTGFWSRGSATHWERSQIRAQPAAIVRPSRPMDRARRPPSKAKPATAIPSPTHRMATQAAGPAKANHVAMPVPNPTASQSGSWPRSRSRKLSTPSRVA